LDTPGGYPSAMDTTAELIARLAAAPAQAPLVADVVFEDYGQSTTYAGREAAITVLRAYFGGGFSDGRMYIHATVYDAKAIVLAFTFRGRHDGAFLGIPATGKEVAVPMILLCHTTNQQIQRIACYYDAGTILRQLGLTLVQ